MIIQSGKIISNNDKNVYFFKTATYEVYYKGFIFSPGEKSGRESIEYIVTNFLSSGNFAFENIFGNYFLCFWNLKNNKQYAFTDNSGVFKAYIYKNCISTSFLELVDFFDEITIEDIDYKSINEFLHLGFTYYENTLINSIKKINELNFYVFKDSVLQKYLKKLAPINSATNLSIQNFFKNLAYSVEDLNVSLDLTGGFDSRLIVSFFNNENANYELAISGQPGNRDINIAQTVANKLCKKLHTTIHSTKDLSVSSLKDIFRISDAQVDVINYHRNHQMNSERQKRNVEIQMGGVGGELYKDYWWLQDFPFYNKKTTNLSKLYDLRIESARFNHSVLGNKLETYSHNFRKDQIKKIESFLLKKNTESYDNIYYNYKMKTNAGVYITIANSYYLSYAPLLELELIKIGFNAMRRERFFNNMIRNWISNNCAEISKIKTTEGISASSSVLSKLSDIIYYILDKGKRFTKQILRKILNKTYFQESANSINIYEQWKNNIHFQAHVQLLKDLEILNYEIDSHAIPDSIVGKISTLGFLVDNFKKVR